MFLFILSDKFKGMKAFADFNTSNVFIYPTLLSHFYFLSYPINPYFSTFFKYFPNLRPEISIFSHMSS